MKMIAKILRKFNNKRKLKIIIKVKIKIKMKLQLQIPKINYPTKTQISSNNCSKIIQKIPT